MPPLLNLTRDAILSSATRFVRGWRLGWGLRFSHTPPSAAHIFEVGAPRRVIIDMWFVFVPLDIVVLDADWRVVDFVEGLRPWRTWRAKSGERFVELAAGTIRMSSTQIGDLIGFERAIS
jgi:uncharacterized membrane protein (UPF0127 family)